MRIRDRPRHYRRAVTIDPGLVEAEIGIGWCCAEIGDFPEAVKVFEGIAKRHPGLIEPLRALAALPSTELRIDLLARLDQVVPDEDDAGFQISMAFIRSAALDRAGVTPKPGNVPQMPTGSCTV